MLLYFLRGKKISYKVVKTEISEHKDIKEIPETYDKIQKSDKHKKPGQSISKASF